MLHTGCNLPLHLLRCNCVPLYFGYMGIECIASRRIRWRYILRALAGLIGVLTATGSSLPGCCL
jgi:hypothetical protein